jgi:hypothetical protein
LRHIADWDWERARRRARIATGRAGRTAFGQGLAHPCLFLHLPKCGGSSLAEALHATVPLHQRVGVIDAVSTRRAAAVLRFERDDPLLCHEDLEHGGETFALRERILLAHAFWGTRLIHGHVLLSDRVRRHLPVTHRIVTLLRHPVERAISNFRMAAHAGVIPPDPETWLSGPVGRRHATVNLRYLAGRSTVGQAEEAECLALALEALDALALVGFLDRLPRFGAAFADMFGPRIALRRMNRARGAEVSLTRLQRQRLEDLCGPDIVVHDRALARFA